MGPAYTLAKSDTYLLPLDLEENTSHTRKVHVKVSKKHLQGVPFQFQFLKIVNKQLIYHLKVRIRQQISDKN